MDLNSSMMVGGALASIAVQGYSCWTRRKKHTKWDRAPLTACVMSCGSGKSTLAKSLKGDSKLLIIDVDEALPRTNKGEAEYLMQSKKHIDDMVQSLPKHKFLLLVNSVEEALHYGVKEQNIMCVCPSNKLFNTLCGGLTTDKMDQMQRSRLELVSSCEKDLLNVFDSFEELYQGIRTAFKLKSNF